MLLCEWLFFSAVVVFSLILQRHFVLPQLIAVICKCRLDDWPVPCSLYFLLFRHPHSFDASRAVCLFCLCDVVAVCFVLVRNFTRSFCVESNACDYLHVSGEFERTRILCFNSYHNYRILWLFLSNCSVFLSMFSSRDM